MDGALDRPALARPMCARPSCNGGEALPHWQTAARPTPSGTEEREVKASGDAASDRPAPARPALARGACGAGGARLPSIASGSGLCVAASGVSASVDLNELDGVEGEDRGCNALDLNTVSGDDGIHAVGDPGVRITSSGVGHPNAFGGHPAASAAEEQVPPRGQWREDPRRG